MVQCMGHIQIRNVPDDVHRTLKARAAKQGMSLSEFLLAEVSGLARLPTLEEHVERVRNRPMADLGASAGDLIRDAREERERELDARR
jgi:antitoxin FitA